MKNLVDSMIRKLGKDGYSVDKDMTSYSLFIVMKSRLLAAFRGFWYKLFLKKSEGILFVGKGCQLKHKHKISLGKTVTIDDGVEINALSRRGVMIGNNVTIKKNTIIECTGVIRELGEGIRIGEHTGISQNCFIQVRGFVDIGSRVIFGPNVSVFSANHNFNNPDVPIMDQGESQKGVIIEDDVWLGSGCIILDGVKIGTGSVVAAGSVVNRDIPPYAVVGGIPATVLKSRKE